MNAVYIQGGGEKNQKTAGKKWGPQPSDKEGQAEAFRNIGRVGIPSPEAWFEELHKRFCVGLELSTTKAVMHFAERLKRFCFF